MIDLSPLRNAKLMVLRRAANVRRRVVLLVKKDNGRTETRIFEPYNRRDNKNGTTTYFGYDTKEKGHRQFNIDNILNVQNANGKKNRFEKRPVDVQPA
jgi:predicted DNA-binding transcriptional regulator YafY